MLGEKKLKQIAQKVLTFSEANQTEVVMVVSQNGLTRFANSQIHQNVAWNDLGISVRAVIGKKIGVASTNSFEDKALKVLVQRAINLAKLQKDDPYFESLPKPQAYQPASQDVYRISEKERASAVAVIIKKAKAKAIVASGAYQSAVSELAVANSLGVWAYHTSSSVDLSTILLGANSTGFAAQVGKKAQDIDASAVAELAIDKVVTSANPIDVEPGEWDVVLEPQAVSEMMAFFNWLGPNARIYHEKASYFSGKLEKKVLGENVTIIDDPTHKDAFPMPFDFEGYPKAKLEIIKNGVLTNICYDSYNARRYKAKNTGHALPAPNTAGPIPLHVYIAPGTKSRNQMIKSVKKGLLVTRLWYVRVLNPRSLAITGMTRDGTFLIKNGKIVAAVKNLRFNQSIPQALQNVVAVENKLTPIASFESEMGINRLPALLIRNWQFSSGTLF
ncbi:hypothetical protein A2966_02720 [Candidatus Roizmanbacteria bacterium RIFCSPLOWO2_01_FULL_41_22]|uniref:Peptidase C69 n=2 Tax=Candidatus Roizmaniibacteriota TaxID=1752723 RepID=A0A1F7J5X3_9BACT|nr:MAG: hypothetical protein A2966_02720 [Candidatus Roizmanbacteria bacterium RIFCSPLOWO2_01_FULL_41_22]